MSEPGRRREPGLLGGIIAAGEGSRLREAGWAVPKPMVLVAGVPLIESAIRNFVAAGITLHEALKAAEHELEDGTFCHGHQRLWQNGRVRT